MRLIGKLLALPFMLVTGILYLVCKFLVVLSGAVLGILSGIIFLAALVLFFVAGFLPGLAYNSFVSGFRTQAESGGAAAFGGIPFHAAAHGRVYRKTGTDTAVAAGLFTARLCRYRSVAGR